MRRDQRVEHFRNQIGSTQGPGSIEDRLEPVFAPCEAILKDRIEAASGQQLDQLHEHIELALLGIALDDLHRALSQGWIIARCIEFCVEGTGQGADAFEPNQRRLDLWILSDGTLSVAPSIQVDRRIAKIQKRTSAFRMVRGIELFNQARDLLGNRGCCEQWIFCPGFPKYHAENHHHARNKDALRLDPTQRCFGLVSHSFESR